MITRIYIDNYKCFSNFEYQPGKNQLLLGTNGTGKSSVFAVLAKLHALVVDGHTASEEFPLNTLTRSRAQDEPVQSFELAVAGNGGVYEYSLRLRQGDKDGDCRVGEERLSFRPDGESAARTLFWRDLDVGRLYADSFKEGPEVRLDWTRSGLPWVYERKDNTRLTWFKERLRRVLCLQINPANMLARSEKEEATPTTDLGNYASWYRHFSQEYASLVFPLVEHLKGVFGDEFVSLVLTKEGETTRLLLAEFATSGGSPVRYRLDELSDGQRALLALYTVAVYARHMGEAGSPGITVCVDEPENYVALREVQPWILEMDDITMETNAQVLIASHHPEFINYYARTDAVRFSRDGSGPVRVAPFVALEDDPLLPSETVARGWEGD